MSDPNLFDPHVDEQARPLIPAGQVWVERAATDQLPLMRQMASMLNRITFANALDSMGHFLQGNAGNAVLHVMAVAPADVGIQGPENWGYDDEENPRPVLSGPGKLLDVSKKRPYLTADGRIVEVAAGGEQDPPEGIELAEQTVWFLPAPEGFHPIALISADLTLLEGSGFLCVGSWIVLFRNPFELWPDIVIPTMSRVKKRSWKSTTLGANSLYTSGKLLSGYRRGTQTLKQFELALCEAAGLRVLETEGVLVRQETAGNRALHWLDDGRSFSLPITTPYRTGQAIPASSGHILQLRHAALYGAEWWQGRDWGSQGVPVHMFRPDTFGFAVRDKIFPVTIFQLGGTTYHAYIPFGDDEEKERKFWVKIAAREHARGLSTFVQDVLGLSPGDLSLVGAGSDGVMPATFEEFLLLLESDLVTENTELMGFSADQNLYSITDPEKQTVNGLEVFAGIAAAWFGVVETSLDVVDPRSFQEVLDYVSRERPAGSQIYVVGEGDSFTLNDFYAMFLDSGELVDIEPEVAAVLPLTQ